MHNHFQRQVNRTEAVMMTFLLLSLYLMVPRLSQNGADLQCKKQKCCRGAEILACRRSLQLWSDSCQCPNYSVYINFVMSTICDSCNTAVPQAALKDITVAFCQQNKQILRSSLYNRLLLWYSDLQVFSMLRLKAEHCGSNSVVPL